MEKCQQNKVTRDNKYGTGYLYLLNTMGVVIRVLIRTNMEQFSTGNAQLNGHEHAVVVTCVTLYSLAVFPDMLAFSSRIRPRFNSINYSAERKNLQYEHFPLQSMHILEILPYRGKFS